MREFLEYVAGQLVDRPEEVELGQETRGGTHLFLLKLPAPEVGKIIGKQGHTIRAIRTLMHAAGERDSVHYALEIVEQ